MKSARAPTYVQPVAGFTDPEYWAATSAEFTALIPVVDAAGGGTINLKAGTFVGPSQGICWDLSTAVNPITVNGRGMGATVLKWPDHYGTVKSSYTAANKVIKLGSNCTLSNLTVDGNKANQTIINSSSYEGCGGVLAYQVSNVKLKDVEVKNCNHSSVSIFSVTKWEINSCNVHDSYNINTSPNFGSIYPDWSWEHPLGIFASSSTKGRILFTDTSDNGENGIQLNACNDTEIYGGKHIHNGWGIKNATGGFVTYKGCGGLYAWNCNDLLVQGITANEGTESGINIDGNSYTARNTGIRLIGNNCNSNMDGGIFADQCDAIQIIGNKCADNGPAMNETERVAGISVAGCYDPVIIGNKCYDTRAGVLRTQLYGIIAFTGSYGSVLRPIVLGNVCTNNRTANYSGISDLGGNTSDSTYNALAGTGTQAYTGTQTFDKSVQKQALEKTNNPTIVGATINYDLSLASVFNVTLDSNISASNVLNRDVSGVGAIQEALLIFTADGTARTVVWPTGTLWPGGTAPTMTGTNGKRDVIKLVFVDYSGPILATVIGQNL